eukprot:1955822-Amphidinium_carterae.1
MAMGKTYPGDDFTGLAQDAVELARWLGKQTPEDVVLHRLRQVKTVQQIIQECETAQVEAHSKMHPQVQAIMRTKKTVAFLQLARSIGACDNYVAEGLRKGFNLMEPVPPSSFG